MKSWLPTLAIVVLTVFPTPPQGALASEPVKVMSYPVALIANDDAIRPTIVRVVDPGAAQVRSAQPNYARASARRVVYRISGDAALRPISVSDDGAKTYIRWSADQPMPATFALGPTGAEQMVEGYVRGGVYTIDRIYGELIFRIDREVARARRKVERSGRG